MFPLLVTDFIAPQHERIRSFPQISTLSRHALMVGRRSIRQWVMRPFTAQEVASAFKALHAAVYGRSAKDAGGPGTCPAGGGVCGTSRRSSNTNPIY
jgi:hypothetical protein